MKSIHQTLARFYAGTSTIPLPTSSWRRLTSNVIVLLSLLLCSVNMNAAQKVGTQTTGTCTLDLYDNGHWIISKKSDPGAMADQNKDQYIWYSGRNSLKVLLIQDGVTYISRNSFEGYTNLSHLSIGANVTSIGTNAFKGCTNLKYVIFNGTTNPSGADAFTNVGTQDNPVTLCAPNIASNNLGLTNTSTEGVYLWKGGYFKLIDNLKYASTWDELKTAMETSGTITLTDNCTDPVKDNNSYLSVPNTKTVNLDLNGKTIDRGLVDANDAGCVIYNNGTLTINGSGKITGGKNNKNGGGINNSGTLTINGCSIEDNSAKLGGGIYFASSTAKVTINGGSITGNSSTNGGGGIYYYLSSSQNVYSLKISGKVTITGNTMGQNPNNVYLYTSSGNTYHHIIDVTAALDNDTRIGITKAPSFNITRGLSGNGTVSNFISDNPDFYVAIVASEARIVDHTVDDTQADRTIVYNLPLHPAGTNVTLMGKGTAQLPYQIGSAEQWDAFATIVNDGKYEARGELTADITFTGNHIQPGEDSDFSFYHKNPIYQKQYTGTFDGKGHTITLNQQATGGSTGNKSNWGGLFWHTKNGATIKNLKVAGRILSTINGGSIIQNVQSTGTTIVNCQSSVIFESTASPGGLVGHEHATTNLTIKNSLFDGVFNKTTTTNDEGGGFVGKQYGSAVINNSYSIPKSISSSYTSFYSISRPEGNSDVVPTINNCYYLFPSTYTNTVNSQGTNASSLSATDICAGLNANAKDENNASCTPWVAHNDTVYLATFAKYVDIVGWTYGSTPNSPTIVGNNGNGTVTYQVKKGTGSYQDYTAGAALDAGDYTLKASVAANNGWNAWESTMNFTVSKASLTVTGTATATAEYGTQVKAISISGLTTKLGETEVAGSWAFPSDNTTVPAVGNTTAYTATFTASSGSGNYNSLTQDITPTITKKALAITAKPKSITYGDAPANDGVNYGEFVNSETPDNLGGTLSYAYNYAQYGDVGSYTIGLTSNNYEITFNAGTLTVAQKDVGLSWSTPTSFGYDGAEHGLTATATGLVNGDEIGVTVAGEQTNAGNHTATASELTGTKAGNYKLPDANTQTFTISRKAVTVTPNDGQSKTYGDADPMLTYTATGLVGSETLTGALAREAGDDVNTYAINQGTVTDANNGNYAITFTEGKTFAITHKTIGISWGPIILTYNNTAQAPTATATGLVGEDVCNLTVTGQQTDVGVYTEAAAPATVTALDNTNYQLPTTGLTTGFEIVNPLSISFAANQTWATWYGGYNYEVPASMTAYKVSAVSGSTVTVDQIDYVPANTGVLIKRTATVAADVNSNVYNGATSAITSLLRNGSPTAYTDYILFNDAFVLSSVSSIGAHRCYLPGTGTAGTRGLTIDIGDGTTSISKIVEDLDSGEWYDLQGRRIEKPQRKGLYIRDGKKVVIK